MWKQTVSKKQITHHISQKWRLILSKTTHVGRYLFMCTFLSQTMIEESLKMPSFGLWVDTPKWVNFVKNKKTSPKNE